VREEVAKVEMWDKYESTSKQWVEFMTQGGLDIPYVNASQRDDGHFYYLIELNNYADIDMLPEKFGSAVEKLDKNKWSEFVKENDASIATHRDFIIRWSSEYSFVPKEPRLKSDERNFIHWIFIHFKLEKRNELLDVLKEWKKLYEDKNINSGYNIWLVELGLDNNMIVLTENFKDGADFYTTTKEISEKVKAEEDVLWSRMAPLLVSLEHKHGYFRPDLSYVKK
jgi:hypothetical protein